MALGDPTVKARYFRWDELPLWVSGATADHHQGSVCGSVVERKLV